MAIIDFYNRGGGSGGGGVTTGQVQSMINASISGMQTTFSGTTVLSATTGHNGDWYEMSATTVSTKQITELDCETDQETGYFEYKALDGATYSFTPNPDFGSLLEEGAEYGIDFTYWEYVNGQYTNKRIDFWYFDPDYDPEGEDPWMPSWYYNGDVTNFENVPWTSAYTLTVYTYPAEEGYPAEPSKMVFGDEQYVQEFATIMETASSTEVGTFVRIDNEWKRPVISDTITNIKVTDAIRYGLLENPDPQTLYNLSATTDVIGSDLSLMEFNADEDMSYPKTLKIYALSAYTVTLGEDYFSYSGDTPASGLTSIQVWPKACYDSGEYPEEYASGINLEETLYLTCGDQTIEVNLIQYYPSE